MVYMRIGIFRTPSTRATHWPIFIDRHVRIRGWRLRTETFVVGEGKYAVGGQDPHIEELAVIGIMSIEEIDVVIEIRLLEAQVKVFFE